MKTIRGLRKLKRPIKGSIVTIGVFDGVHIGHRKVINKVVSAAKKLCLKSVVLTFDPHPLKVLHTSSGVPSLISLNHRIKLIKELGLDVLVILKFTKSIAGLAPEKFVRDILICKIGMKEIYVGKDFYFGKGASSGPEVLKNLAKKFLFKTTMVKSVKIGRNIVSSSVIRRFIINGNIEKASRFLGRPVSVLGTVVGGSKLARVLGYPTANINPHHEAIPPSGVYAVRVRFKKRVLKGVLNIGSKPTFYSPKDRKTAIEVHIFDFDKRIYGRELEVLFVKKIRDEFKFKDKDALVAQIRQDEAIARKLLR